MTQTHVTAPIDTSDDDVSASETVKPSDSTRGRKRKTSRGLKHVQEIERGMAKASQRVSRAVEKGFATYLDRRDRSAARRRDGAIRDAPENWARAAGRMMRVSSRAPLDIAKPVNAKSMNKRLRRVAKTLMRPFFR